MAADTIGNFASFVVKKGKKEILNARTNGIAIGTSGTCDVVIRDPIAAAEHCRFSYDGSNFVVADGVNATGTYVNGVSAQGSPGVNDGAEVVVGATRFTASVGNENDGTPKLELKMKLNSFHIDIGKTRTADRDKWSRKELALTRFFPLRLFNYLAVILGLVLVGGLFVKTHTGAPPRAGTSLHESSAALSS